jgi:hypothetical protein
MFLVVNRKRRLSQHQLRTSRRDVSDSKQSFPVDAAGREGLDLSIGVGRSVG